MKPEKSRRLHGKVALVLGAGSVVPGWGDGKASAVAYSRAGAKVVATDLYQDRAEETRKIIEEDGGEAIASSGDVSSAGDMQKLVDLILQTFGHIDILHNNVGICLAGGAIDLSEDDWNRSMDCNLESVSLACKYILPVMQKQRPGVITNITNISSTLSTHVSRYDEIAYYASRAGFDNLTRAVAAKHPAEGIRSNAIQPGLINTPLLHENKEVVTEAQAPLNK